MDQRCKILVVSAKVPHMDNLVAELQAKGFVASIHPCVSTLLGTLFTDLPDMIMVNLVTPTPELVHLVGSLKSESYFSVVPVLGLVDRSTVFPRFFDDVLLDDFLVYPLDYDEVLARICLALNRIHRVFDNNPLTRLPGNTSVQNAITEAIGTPMAVCYLDINNFKPFNDVYGFAHGDEVLRMLSRIMSNAVKETGGGFSGHIGGDDFVFIVPQERAEQVCTMIIDNFSTIAAELFDDHEKNNGFFIAKNRKGEVEQFPLLSIAIVVIATDSPPICHCGKVAEVAAELKTLAKQSGGNCYVFDKRMK